MKNAWFRKITYHSIFYEGNEFSGNSGECCCCLLEYIRFHLTYGRYFFQQKPLRLEISWHAWNMFFKDFWNILRYKQTFVKTSCCAFYRSFGTWKCLQRWLLMWFLNLKQRYLRKYANYKCIRKCIRKLRIIFFLSQNL